ncbi:MAG: phage tail fiber protein [Janthinobacterium lividum]
MFVDGYLALVASFGGNAAAEVAVAGYGRQPISFSVPIDGTFANSTPWNFGSVFGGAVQPTLAGLAVYDAAAGGRLLLAWPFSTPRQYLPGYSPRSGDVGELRLSLAALAGIHSGAAFTGTLPAATAIGLAWDNFDRAGHFADPGGSVPIQQYNRNPLSSGIGLTITRGILAGAP